MKVRIVSLQETGPETEKVIIVSTVPLASEPTHTRVANLQFYCPAAQGAAYTIGQELTVTVT